MSYENKWTVAIILLAIAATVFTYLAPGPIWPFK